MLLLAGICLGVLSLTFAYGDYTNELFFSYLQNEWIVVLNILPVVMLLGLLYGMIGRAWIAFLVTSVVTLGFSMANYYMLRFRDDPLMFEDLKHLREALSITKTAKYNLTPDLRVWFGLFCVVLGTLFLWFLVRGIPERKTRLPLFLLGMVLCVPLVSLYTNTAIYKNHTKNDAHINQWAATQVYFSKGFVYPFLHSMTEGAIQEPEGYREAETKALLEGYVSADIPEEQKVDVITLQLEAFADFSRFEDVEGIDWEAAYATYHELEKESYTGNLLTSIFAGGTVDTERAFLTGYADLWNFRSNTNSYAWYFQQQGYTVEGSHPSYDWFYNRRNINTYLGMSDYYFFDGHYENLSSGMTADELLFPEILRLYQENREEDKPYFSFNVTYQGHGPYSTESAWRKMHFTDGRYSTATTNIVDNYLASLADTSKNLQWLIDQLRVEERPVVLVVYGDHKPWLGDGNTAYQELGVNLDTSTEEGFYNYYGTRYLIWANDTAKQTLGNSFTGEGADVSACFLMNLLFELCGWEGNAFMQATNEIRDVLPAVTTVDGYIQNGQFTKALDEVGLAALHTYRDLEYYHGKHFAY